MLDINADLFFQIYNNKVRSLPLKKGPDMLVSCNT